jgi:hypothetical protein
MSSQPPATPEDPSGPDSSTPAGSGGIDADIAYVSPLLPDDPPKIDNFWLDGRLGATPAGVAFTGHDDADTPAMIILLSEGAADDAAARDRFSGVINSLHIDTVLARGGQGQDTGRLAQKFRRSAEPPAPDDRQPAPWAALAYDGSREAAAEAERILRETELSRLPQQGEPAGPDYRLYWIDRVKPGLARLWPLPWPGRFDRAGWKTILVSWLLVLLLAAVAVLIAILLFHNQRPQSPPQPVPRTVSAPPQSGSPSPQSGSPSPGTSPSKGQSPSKSGSPSPSGSQPGGQPSHSGSGSPSPRSKL